MSDLTYLTVDTVPRLWHERERFFSSPSADLAALKQIDSAGIAFLVQWAKANGGGLRLSHAPDRLRGLLSAYRLSELFSLDDEAEGD